MFNLVNPVYFSSIWRDKYYFRIQVERFHIRIQVKEKNNIGELTMKQMMMVITLMALGFLLAACGGEGNGGEAVNDGGDVVDVASVENNAGETGDSAVAVVEADTAVTTTNNNDTTTQSELAAALSEDYEDALSIQAQLALGTVQLEETELAVAEAQANNWQDFRQHRTPRQWPGERCSRAC